MAAKKRDGITQDFSVGSKEDTFLPDDISQDVKFHHDQRDPIAIIGLSCRFPGAKNPEEFWQLLCNGVDAITKVPASRWDINAFYHPDPSIPGKISSQWGGFLEDIDLFDPYFFGISPKEAGCMDPQQRILLEVAWEALEDAGQIPGSLSIKQTGVFLGACNSDFGKLQEFDPSSINIYTAVGSAGSVLAGRLSYILGLEGPSIVSDTACSSSLVAVHLACQSLRRGECSTALAGGANLILSPAPSMGFSRARMLAPDGRCKTFDASANGFVRSDGFGIVVLKPLSAALLDKDPIYAVIKGSAVNNDGQCSGLLMTPGVQGQEAVLRAAYRDAGILPNKVNYVETHGTGTSVGDPVELQALGRVLGEGRSSNQPCIIGSVKTNIGHTEASSGIAGLIKVALSLKYGIIPQNLHFHAPNPHIPWQELSFVVQQRPGPWPTSSQQAIAGISSFGIAGTNAHVVLEAAPQLPLSSEKTVQDTRPHILTLSAHTSDALNDVAKLMKNFISHNNESLRDICYTASMRRLHHKHRLAVIGHSKDEMIEILDDFLQGKVRPEMVPGHAIHNQRPKVVFVFPGQGSQWLGMGRELIAREPVFRETLEHINRIMSAYVDWSLLEVLMTDEAQNHLGQIDIVQPVLFALQVALATLWRSWGVEPDFVVGHSMGEIAATYIAGALNLENAVQIICRRSQLLRQMSGKGKMVVLEASLEQTQHFLADYAEQISIAAYNGPRSVVLSGEADVLQELVDKFQKQNIFCRFVNVDVASHSPQMDVLREDLLQLLQGLCPRDATIPIYSTVVGAFVDGDKLEASYWVQNLREPVLFWPAIKQLLQNESNVFIEISSHPILLGSIQQGLLSLEQSAQLLPSLRKAEEWSTMLKSLCSLYAIGGPIRWSSFYPDSGKCVQFPLYPWQRERFWLDKNQSSSDKTRELFFAQHHSNMQSRHPFLQNYWESALHKGTHFWDARVNTHQTPYLNDHRIQGTAVLPGAAYIEMVVSAAKQTFQREPGSLENITFTREMFLSKEDIQKVQVVISSEMDESASFHIFSSSLDTAQQQQFWVSHASGVVKFSDFVDTRSERRPIIIEEIQNRCTEVLTGAQYYQRTLAWGLEYGPNFQGLIQIWRRDSEAIAKIHIPALVEAELQTYHVHPVLIDICFQALAAIAIQEKESSETGSIYLLQGIDHLQIDHPDSSALWSYAFLDSKVDLNADVLKGNVLLLDKDGQVQLEASGISARRIGHQISQQGTQDIKDYMYDIQWESQALLLEKQHLSTRQGIWLIFADQKQVGQQLATHLSTEGNIPVMVYPGKMYEMVTSIHYRVDPAKIDDFHKLIKEVVDTNHHSCCGIIHLWSLDSQIHEETTIASLEDTQVQCCYSTLHLVQALVASHKRPTPRLWLVTGGVQAVGIGTQSISVAQAPLWGLGRTISHEHPEFRCTLVDISLNDLPIMIPQIFQEISADSSELQVTLRNNARYVARLRQCSLAIPQRQNEEEQKRTVLPHGVPFCLEIPTPGSLDNLVCRQTTHCKPAANEVEIEIYAAGLNFSDVMKAMGIYPGLPEGITPLGIECSGKISTLGEEVDDFQVGDEVIAISPFPSSCLGSYVTIPSMFVFPKPAHLSFEEAATIPVAFMTAYYALHHLARITVGERVLIHAATGGVGLAAIQLARHAGAEIFATAGSEEKRNFLRSLGIQYIMDSRSLTFADEIMKLTNGKGVDIIVNSLSGEAILKNLLILGTCGRYLELGKRDIYQNNQLNMGVFKKNGSFFAIDIDQLVREKPAFVRSQLYAMLQLFKEGVLKPVPVTLFPISEATEAFRHMARAKHMGKIALSVQDPHIVIQPDATSLLPAIRSDATYLITGGLGGLGLTVAQWLVQRGARNLLLSGRTQAPPSVEEVLSNLRRSGVEVKVAYMDVGQESQLMAVLAEIRQTMQPLRGIIHAAGVLDDGILLQLNRARFQSVMLPKVNGAWNLHSLTLHDPLDFFVLFSSAASLIGSPGQGNYAAANAFLDALAHYRCNQHLPALSINWGPWAEIGLAARPDRGGRLEFRGFESIPPQKGLEALEHLIQQNIPQVAVMPLNLQKWQQFYSNAAENNLFTHLIHADNKNRAREEKKSSLLRELTGSDPTEAEHLLESYLREQVARIIGCATSRLDMDQPLNRLGIDSLMAVELKNRLEADLTINLPIADLLQGPSVSGLKKRVLHQLRIEDQEQPALMERNKVIDNSDLAWREEHQNQLDAEIDQQNATQILEKLDQLTENELDQLISMLEEEAQ